MAVTGGFEGGRCTITAVDVMMVSLTCVRDVYAVGGHVVAEDTSSRRNDFGNDFSCD